MSSKHPARTSQTGAGLIEVLVALLVLSMGLLGLIRLQTTGVKMAQSASNRLEATLLATEMLERMRLNRVDALTGLYTVDYGALPSAVVTSTSPWAQDLQEWKAALAARLPDGDGEISMLLTQATITVRWSEAWDADSADGLARVFLRSEL